MKASRTRIGSVLAILAAWSLGCTEEYVPAPFLNREATLFTLNEGASGVSEVVNNIANVTVVSNDPNELKAEYQAGFVIGHLQGQTIEFARDNAMTSYWWVRGTVTSVLLDNYGFLIEYLRNHSETAAGQRLTRLLFRLLGMYHGATRGQPAALDFSGDWLPEAATFEPAELKITTGGAITFLDLYLLNARNDLNDIFRALPADPHAAEEPPPPGQCSAFVKRTAADVIMAHTTWSGYRSQTMALTVGVNGDRMTSNAISPGTLGVGNDFGYNNKGLLFNETSFSYGPTEAKVRSLWTFWRVAAAAQFAGSIDEFVAWLQLDESATYFNGYALVDVKTGEMGLYETSETASILLRSNGGEYSAVTWPAGLNTEFDSAMLTPNSIAQFNYPASRLIRSASGIAAGEWPPYVRTRYEQFQQLLPGVTDLASARELITWSDPALPESIFGRLDLAEVPLPIGAIDAKVANIGMVRDFMNLAGVTDVSAPTTGFWMRYGSAPDANGWPFVWSRYDWQIWNSAPAGNCVSPSWCGRGHPGVPDQLDGVFTQLNLHLR